VLSKGGNVKQERDKFFKEVADNCQIALKIRMGAEGGGGF